MSVEWSAPAEASLTEFSDYLHERDPRLAKVARDDIKRRTNGLGSRPGKGRPSRWAGLHELSLTRWRKIVVYRVAKDRILIVAFYDARQDLTKVKPQSTR